MSLDPQTGYVIDTEYTHYVFAEMFPRHLAYVCATQGVHTRLTQLDEGFDYCELGCGNGLGSNVMAAANPQGRFVGVDLNPTHIANAQRLAKAGGLENVRFLEATFGDLLDRDDLPEFDLITLHGVYSWIGDRHRAEVVEFIRRKLRPGGVVYVSYNTQPGWSDLMPVRKLMMEHTAGMNISSIDRAAAALDFLKSIAATGAGLFADGTRAAGFVRGLEKQTREYLVHEYLNTDWQPHYSADVAREMAQARLSFVGDATIRQNYLALMVAEPLQKFIEAAPNATEAQTRRDFLTSTQFRRDIFVKGGNKAQALDREALFASMRFGEMKGEEVPASVSMPGRDVNIGGLTRDVVLMCREVPLRAEVIFDNFVAKGHSSVTASFNLEVLMAAGLLELVRGGSDGYPHFPGIEEAKVMRFSLGTFNRAVCEFAFAKRNSAALAAPFTGSALVVSWVEAGLLLGWDLHGYEAGIDWCAARVQRTGQSLMKDGIQLSGQAEHVAYLKEGLRIMCVARLSGMIRSGAATLA